MGFVDFADDSDVDHSTFDSSQCASRMVKDHQKGSSFVVHREDGMVQGSEDEEGPTLRCGNNLREAYQCLGSPRKPETIASKWSAGAVKGFIDFPDADEYHSQINSKLLKNISSKLLMMRMMTDDD